MPMRSFFFLPLLLLGVSLGTIRPVFAQANIPVVVTTCSTCEDQPELQIVAAAYLNTWVGKTPPGYAGIVSLPGGLNDCGSGQGTATTLFVISTAVPLSQTFYACYISGPHGAGKLVAATIGPATTAGAIAADNAVLHRSVPEGSLTLPGNITWTNTSDPPEVAEAWVQGALILTDTGTSFWHGLSNLPNMPQVTFGKFLNTQTNTTFEIYAGDTITVTDANGYSAQVEWNPLVSPPWKYVAGSLRYKGQAVPNTANLPPGPSPSNGGAFQGVGPITITLPGGPTQTITPVYDNTTPGGSVSIGPLMDTGPGGSSPPPDAGCANPDCKAA